MDESALERYRRRHNQIAWLKAIGWSALAVPMWCISWGLMWLGFVMLMGLWGDVWHGYPSWAMCRWAAWIGVGLLAVEGFRYHRKLFSLEEYRQSWYWGVYAQGENAPFVPVIRGNPLAVPYGVSQFLFIAPRSVVNAIRAVRSVVKLNEEASGPAAAIGGDLAGKAGWSRAETLRTFAAGVQPLAKLGILHHRVKDGVVEVQLDRDFVTGWVERPSE